MRSGIISIPGSPKARTWKLPPILASQITEKYRTTACNPSDCSFTLEFSPLGSLATRDIVARACDQKMKTTGANNVWLVTDHLDKKFLHSHFPTIEKRLNKRNLSLGIDPLPVAPAAHYMVGGLSVDIDSRVLQPNGDPIPLLAEQQIGQGMQGKPVTSRVGDYP